MEAPIISALIGVSGAAAIGVAVDRIRLGIRVTVLEALFHEKSKNVLLLDEKSDLHSNRITAIESIVPELRHLANSLRDVPAVLVALKEMILNDRERTRDLEVRVNSTLQGVPGVQGVQGQQGQRGLRGESGHQ